MSVARSVADVLRDHVVLELEAIDRMYLNVYVPHLQAVRAVVGYLRGHRGQRFASTTAVVPMSEAFVRNIEQFVADERIDLISFDKKQRKDDVTQKYLRCFRRSEGVLYVGKAKNLRNRVRSYFNDDRLSNSKTGTLIHHARVIDYIHVDNEKEALALENNLIKQWKPRFNILLRDDKTYPYIKLTAEKYPRVYVTRRLKKDGSTYYGPYFPGNLAHRLVDLIHRSFLIPSCKVDLSRYHPRACLQYYIKRCLGPCVEGFTTPDDYRQAIRDVQLFLEGKPGELERRPCLLGPYHRRLDWLIWFSAMEDQPRDPWLIHLVWKLLDGDRTIRELLAVDPFDGQPPRFAQLARRSASPSARLPVWPWRSEFRTSPRWAQEMSSPPSQPRRRSASPRAASPSLRPSKRKPLPPHAGATSCAHAACRTGS